MPQLTLEIGILPLSDATITWTANSLSSSLVVDGGRAKVVITLVRRKQWVVSLVVFKALDFRLL